MKEILRCAQDDIPDKVSPLITQKARETRFVITFKVLKTIPEFEHKTLFEWGPDIFQGSLYNLQWRPPDIHIVGYFEDQPVTHVGLVVHDVKVGSVRLKVGGIGGVVTVPQHQKKGFSKQCLVYSQAYIKSNFEAEFGFLFCPERLVDFYGSVGWKRITAAVLVDQSQGKVAPPLNAMVLEFSKVWPKGPVDLESLPW